VAYVAELNFNYITENRSDLFVFLANNLELSANIGSGICYQQPIILLQAVNRFILVLRLRRTSLSAEAFIV
jgi:hypothetical protein